MSDLIRSSLVILVLSMGKKNFKATYSRSARFLDSSGILLEFRITLSLQPHFRFEQGMTDRRSFDRDRRSFDRDR